MRTPSTRYARSRAWCEWDDFGAWHARMLPAAGDAQAAEVPPFHLLSLPGATPAQQRDGATRWMAQRLAASAAARASAALEFAAHPVADGGRIRIGYLSSDLQDHATAHLMIEMLEAHDHERFEIHAFSYGHDEGRGMRQRIEAAVTWFTDLAPLDDAQAAMAIHAAGIHILVDLKGFTAGTRSALMAWRPAPVLVNYLGYPGTLGGSLCDYLIGDGFVTPPHSTADFAEALAVLPHSYQPHGRKAVVEALPTRAELGLPQDALVLCCFNQAFKFTPEVFSVWCTLLDRAPGSVLWLLQDEQCEGNLRLEAMARGIAPQRLVFAPHQPQAMHLGRIAAADLVLDTLPYNAHTTASDALWAGVPVLTCAGDTFASRVAGSLLHAVGLPELVTQGLDAYAALGVQLVTQPARLQALRAKLAAQREAAPLFDVLRYTRDLESLYAQMWQRCRDGLAPAALVSRPGLNVPPFRAPRLRPGSVSRCGPP